jgi:hypothetical protein
MKLDRFKAYLRPLSKILLLWAVIFMIVAAGVHFGVDKKVIGVSVAIFGFLTNAFAGLLTLIAFVPFIGPLIVKVVTLPISGFSMGSGISCPRLPSSGVIPKR